MHVKYIVNKTFSALLETGRVSNLPTVWSNLLLGFVIAGACDIAALVLLCLAGSLLYVGGCFLGDARDVAFDIKHRPSRPIPSGVLSERGVWLAGAAILITGALGFFFLSPAISTFFYGAFPLFLVILCYALFHKVSPAIGLPLIGACRGLLLWSAYLCFSSSPFQAPLHILLCCCGLTLYTICFASVARFESSDKKITFSALLKILMLCCAFLPLLFTWKSDVQLLPSLLAVLLYSLWLLFAFRKLPEYKGAYVSACLSGFSLLDCVYISAFGFPSTLICLALFILAHILQKISPAT